MSDKGMAAGHARYIGRLGALAVALGVGVAVASTPGTAWAQPSDSSSSADADSSGTGTPGDVASSVGSADSTASDSTASTSAGVPAGGDALGGVATGVADGSGVDDSDGAEAAASSVGSGGARAEMPSVSDTVQALEIVVRDGENLTDDAIGPDVGEAGPSSRRGGGSSARVEAADGGSASAEAPSSPAAPARLVRVDSSLPDAETDDVATSAVVTGQRVSALPAARAVPVRDSIGMRSAAAAPASVPAIAAPDLLSDVSTVMGSVVSSFMAVVLSPLTGAGPHAPGGPSPMLWALAAAVRREFDRWQHMLFNQSPQVNDQSLEFRPAVPSEVMAPVAFDATDPDGDPLRFRVVEGPAHGTVTINEANDTFVYDPEDGFEGTDSFTVVVSDRQHGRIHLHGLDSLLNCGAVHQDTATVTISVTPTRAPVAGDDTYSTAEDQPLTRPAGAGVLANNTDPDTPHQNLTASVASGPGHGTLALHSDGSFTYTPATDFAGADSFTYTVSDGTKTDTGTVNLTVTPVADTPTVTVTTPAIGAEDSGIPLTITATPADIDGSETLTVTVGGVAAGAQLSAGTDNHDGTWTLTSAQLAGLKLTPPPDSAAGMTLTVAATSHDGTSSATSSPVSLVVIVNPVADAPTVTVTSPVTGAEDSDIALGITAALTDGDGSETLSVTIGGVPAGAQLSAGTDNHDGTWTLTSAQLPGLSVRPPAGSDADFTLSVTASSSDGASTATSAIATVNVVVTAVNDAPVLIDNGPRLTNFSDGSVLGSVVFEDPENDALTYSVTGQPARGSVVLNADGTFTYTPTMAARIKASTGDSRFTTDTFTITADDGAATTSTVVTVVVNRAVPTGTVVSYESTPGVHYDAASPDGLTAYRLDPDGTLRVFDVVSGQVKGEVVVSATSSIAAATSRDGTRLYVANAGDGTGVAVISTDTTHDTYELVTTIPVGTPALALQVSPDGKTAYVVNGQHLIVVDTVTNSVTTTINAGNVPVNLVISPDGSRVYVGNLLDNTVSVIDAATNTELTRVHSILGPIALAVSPDGSLVYALTGGGGSRLSVIDTATNQLLTVLDRLGVPPGGATRGSLLTVAQDGSVYLVKAGEEQTAVTAVKMMAQSDVQAADAYYGTVQGWLGITDPDGDPLTYTFISDYGSVVANPDGSFTFTPTNEARSAASSSPGQDVGEFTVTASDGRRSVSTTISVPIVEQPLQTANVTGAYLGPDSITYEIPEVEFVIAAPVDPATLTDIFPPGTDPVVVDNPLKPPAFGNNATFTTFFFPQLGPKDALAASILVGIAIVVVTGAGAGIGLGVILPATAPEEVDAVAAVIAAAASGA